MGFEARVVSEQVGPEFYLLLLERNFLRLCLLRDQERSGKTARYPINPHVDSLRCRGLGVSEDI
jgi:hypothetical protein